MPRRKQNVESDDDSSYNENGDSTNFSDDRSHEERGDEEDNDDSDQRTDNDLQTSNGSPDGDPTSTSKPKKKRKKKSFDTILPDDLLSSADRKTKHGGYAHTNQSKSKISQANTGNTPWNKGKNRSSADRAKIAAGVRARNRAILLEKLKRLGMSEEEWEAKKREIKYLRERIRRAKSSKEKHDLSEAERKLKAADAERKLKAAIEATTVEPSGEAFEIHDRVEDKGSEVAEEVFSKEVAWTPFSFGEQGGTYDKYCPNGGPGGYVCCEECAAKYTHYVSGTVKDVEKHRTTRNGNEVKELVTFLKQGQGILENAYNVAKKRIPPLPPKSAAPKVVPEPATTSRKAGAGASAPTQWNITSTFDIERANSTLTPI